MAGRFPLRHRKQVAGARRQSGRLMELPILIAVVFIAAAIFIPKVTSGEGIFLSLLESAGWVAAIIGGLLALAFVAELPGMVRDWRSTPVAVRAARKGDALAALQKIKPERLDVRAADRFGNTALHVICDSYDKDRQRDAPAVIDFLSQHGADVNVENEHGKTALDLAVERGSGIAVVRRLLAASARPRDALTWAVMGRSGDAVEVVKALIDAGASVNQRKRDFDMTPLHWAARSGGAEMVRFLLEKGAEINAPDPDGLTPLHHSMWLLGINEERTAEVIKTLVAAGANRDAADKKGETPRARAEASGNPALIAAMNGAPGA